MRTPLKAIRIECDNCKTEMIQLEVEEGLTTDQLSAVLSVSGWLTARGRDICPTCALSFTPRERKS